LHDVIWNGATFIAVGDGGNTWMNPLPFGGGTGYWFTDLAYENGLYIAATRNLHTVNNCQGDSIGNAKVSVSTDGKVWHDILLRDEPATSFAILHDGIQFITTGSDSTVFASGYGHNWTALQTPVQGVDYLSAAWNGSKLVAAGRIGRCYWMIGNKPTFERPIGISSIDGYHKSRGMAYGNGRFVSVGRSAPVSGEGASSPQ
jgi:hypothetical protein